MPRARFLPLSAALGALATLAVLAGCEAMQPSPAPEADFRAYCVSCHGEDGKGDGADAARLRPRPSDLTRIAARNRGVFPMTRVMSVIDGYTRGEHGHGGPMPEFGELLDSRSVLYDDGKGGPPVPVPERLINLARYLESIQE